MSEALSKPQLIQDFDIGTYREDKSVDMSGYIPLSKRFDETKSKVKPNSKPFFIEKKLNGSIPRVLQRNGGWVSSEVRQRRRIFHRAKTGIKLALSRGKRLRWLTLTTYKDYEISRLSKDLQVFRKRVEHATFEHDGFYGFHLEYCGVSTSEGNGVFHLLYARASHNLSVIRVP